MSNVINFPEPLDAAELALFIATDRLRALVEGGIGGQHDTIAEALREVIERAANIGVAPS